MNIITTELAELKEKYGNERRTKIVASAVDTFSQEDLIPNEDIVIMITRDGYIKRIAPDTFKTQSRGGKGVIGLTTKEEDSISIFFTATTHANILYFTTRGRVFQLKGYDVPVASRTAKGSSLVNFLQISGEEKVNAVLSLDHLDDAKYLIMVTRNGTIKKVDLADFANVRRSGLISIKLKEGDALQWVKPSSGSSDVVLVSKAGQAIRFNEKGVRPMGRAAAGVRGIRLKNDDKVVGMDVFSARDKDTELVVVMSNGYGKRSSIDEYKLQSRGGSGIKTANVTKKTGELVSGRVVNSATLEQKRDLMAISMKGQTIRLPLKSIPTLGRATQGVRVMRFKEPDDQVARTTLV